MNLILISPNRGHHSTNPNTALRGNPSRLPYICIVWSSPSGCFNDPCQITTMTSPRSKAPRLSLATSCNHSAGGDFHHGSSQMADGSEICWAAADRENLSPIFAKVYISYISTVVGSTFSCCSLSNVVEFKLVWPSNRICLWRQLQTFMKVPLQKKWLNYTESIPWLLVQSFLAPHLLATNSHIQHHHIPPHLFCWERNQLVESATWIILHWMGPGPGHESLVPPPTIRH